MTAQLTDIEFADHMRARRGAPPLDTTVSHQPVTDAIRKRFEYIDWTKVSIGNLVAMVRGIPGVTSARVVSRTAGRLELEVGVHPNSTFSVGLDKP